MSRLVGLTSRLLRLGLGLGCAICVCLTLSPVANANGGAERPDININPESEINECESLSQELHDSPNIDDQGKGTRIQINCLTEHLLVHLGALFVGQESQTFIDSGLRLDRTGFKRTLDELEAVYIRLETALNEQHAGCAQSCGAMPALTTDVAYLLLLEGIFRDVVHRRNEFDY